MLALKMAFRSGLAARCVQTSIPCSASKAFSPVRTLCARWPHAAQTAGSGGGACQRAHAAGTSERSPSATAVSANVPSVSSS